MSTDRPNILLLVADQQRWNGLGCYGNEHVKTPNIDALARRGTRYRNAFCTSPLCGPSRCSFLTGTHPHTNGGVTHPNERHRSGKKYRPQLEPGIESLVAHFRDSGYRTHATGYIGFHHYDGDRNLEHDLNWLGFQTAAMRGGDYVKTVGKEVARRYNLADIKGEMWEPEYANVEGAPFPYGEDKLWDTLIADANIEFLNDAVSDEQPFLLYCGFRAPHTPWCPPQRFLDMIDPETIKLPDYRAEHHHIPRRLRERIEYFDIRYYPEEMVRRSMAAYFAFVSYMDHCAGRILKALEDSGQADNTIVVFASDHGEMLYDHGLCEKHCFYESAVRIPLIVSDPEGQGGQTAERLVSLMDVLPSLMRRSDVPVPNFTEDVDLESGRDYVLAEYYHSLDPCRMLRDRRYKYIHTEEDICELYDLENDPGELFNLAWYPEYREQVEKYDALVMEDWEIPHVPVHGTWNDLNERKQRQRLAGLDITDPRPPLPEWARPQQRQ
ncbi:MAG: sulfatase [Verrucomicrobiota bacterium]